MDIASGDKTQAARSCTNTADAWEANKSREGICLLEQDKEGSLRRDWSNAIWVLHGERSRNKMRGLSRRRAEHARSRRGGGVKEGEACGLQSLKNTCARCHASGRSACDHTEVAGPGGGGDLGYTVL